MTDPALDTVPSGIDYIGFLKGRGYLGQLHPWRRGDPTPPLIAMLVPDQMALDEVTRWSGQDFTLNALRKYLKENGCYTYSDFKNTDDFVKAKEKHNKMKVFDKDKLRDITEAIAVSPKKIADDGNISGKNGSITADSRDIHIVVSGTSKRHFSAIKRKLGFAELVEHSDTGGKFRLNRMPSETEAPIIRKVVGIKKSPERDRPFPKMAS